jgi:hypothetical protein
LSNLFSVSYKLAATDLLSELHIVRRLAHIPE